MAMLRAAALIDKGQRANADGYTRVVGYTSQVGYTKPVGYTNVIYAAPIGDLATKSAEEAALESAYKADGGGSETAKDWIQGILKGDSVGIFAPITRQSESVGIFAPITRQSEKVEEKNCFETTPTKKSLIDRIKENPAMYGLIAAFLVIITFGIYKSKKG